MAGMMTAILGAGGPREALSTTLTIGTATAGAGLNLRGFSSAVILGYTPTTFGSLTLATLSDGKTCVSVYDARDNSSPSYAAVLSINGFSSDPGQGYLFDVTANGATRLGSAATGYSYAAGRAIWEWEDVTTAFLFGFATSGSTSVVIRIT